MEVIFDKTYLSDLYYEGKTSDKKHRFQPQIIRKYIRVIDILIGAPDVEALYPFNGLNYKTLVGDKAGLESVRINDQYRLEFKTEKVVSETILTICNVIELTNHYED